MKKFLTLLTIALSLVLINHSCKPKEEEEPEPGSIYGVVTDKATGEPVKNANVQLRPTGETTLTGNDGRYEFLDVKNGEYSISVSKTGYTNLVDDYVIIVDGPKEMRRDVQIEKLPAALKVVDDKGEEISELDFGNQYDDVSRMFSIFNDGPELLNYEIVKTAAWITSLSVTEGSLEPGATKPIVVNIDREKLQVGENTTTLHITSNNGSKQLTIHVEKQQVLNIVDNNGNEVNELDFGSDDNELSRTFNILNNGGAKLHYQITKSVDWISNISSTEGDIDGGGTLVIVVTIDRAKLPVGDNSTTLIVSTNNGNKQLAVKAKKMPSEIIIQNNDGNEITKLDFGTSNTSMTFNIYNKGYETINYQITKAADWIESINNMEGTIEAGLKKPIVVVINRNIIPLGDNNTLLQITSDIGSKQLEVKCNGGNIVTSAATDITETSAKLKGTTTNSTYTEKGFYFGKNSNTSEKYVVEGNNTGNFSYQINDLEEGETYYFKAYLVHNNQTYYGDIKSFTTEASFFIAEGCGPGGCDLIVDKEGLGMAKWSTKGELSDLSSIDFSDIDGQVNMNVLRNYCQDLSYFPAAQQCAQKGSDWYLPSVEELKNIFNKYFNMFPKNVLYWTSSYAGRETIYDEFYDTNLIGYTVYTVHGYEENGMNYYQWKLSFVGENGVYVLPVKRAN